MHGCEVGLLTKHLALGHVTRLSLALGLPTLSLLDLPLFVDSMVWHIWRPGHPRVSNYLGKGITPFSMLKTAGVTSGSSLNG